MLKTAEDLAVIGSPEHLALRADAADTGITLVKDTWNQLPLTPEKHRRIRLYLLEGEVGGIYAHDPTVRDNVVAELEKRGFEVTVNDGSTRVRGKTLTYRENVDAALVVSTIAGYGAQNNYRVQWQVAMSSDAPWHVHEVPTFFVSLNYTTHLHDLPMMKTAINAYHSNEEIIRQVIDKMTGVSAFKGVPNELVWAGNWQSRL